MQLKSEENLEHIIAEGKDEWEKMVLLCRWAYNQWSPSKPRPYPRFNAMEILSRIRAGETGGHCDQYAVVLVQALLSLGWQARYLDIDAEPSRGGHVSVEVWSNQHNKWAVLDPHFGCYFQKESSPGVPLSALEIHKARVMGKRVKLIETDVGGDQKAHPPPKAVLADFFHHLAADMRNNHLSEPLHAWNRSGTYLSWTDAFTPGKPDIYTLFSKVESDFEFPMNQIQISFQSLREDDQLGCLIKTNMPHAEFIKVIRNDEPARFIPLEDDGQKKEPDIMLMPVREHGVILVWRLKLFPGKHRISFQPVNGSGVEGPPAVFELLSYPR
jgi:hypothetical protein